MNRSYYYALLIVLFLSCNEKDNGDIPDVITIKATDVNDESAILGGEIISDGSGEIINKGICWSTESNPTIDHLNVTAGAGSASFSMKLSLESQTVYYAKAFATNQYGVGYGVQDTFYTSTFSKQALELKSISNIKYTSAAADIEFIDWGGGGQPLKCAVCISTSPNPVFDESQEIFYIDESGGFVDKSMKRLMPDTKYYVRIWTMNPDYVIYSNELSFTTNTYDGKEVEDYDGNKYNVVQIGSQFWLAENLKTRHRNDGSVIEGIYDYSDEINEKYGLLYPKVEENVCPAGWRTPHCYGDFGVLADNFGGFSIAGDMLKAPTDWHEPYTGSNDGSGFNALPISTSGIGQSTAFWTQTIDAPLANHKDYFRITLSSSSREVKLTSSGYAAIRCVKGEE